MSIKVLELELTEGIAALAVETAYTTCRVLVRLNRQPIGWLSLPCSRQPVIPAADVALALQQQLGWPIWFQAQHNFLQPEIAPQAVAAEGISVIVCTRDRTQFLAICLSTLLALDYPAFEIIVVDNAPSTDATCRLVSKLPVKYVLEKRPGLDVARNRGIAEARYSKVAFTDDDARADRFWLQAVAQNFRDPDVAAVTGFVAPAELETPAQRIFELGYGGMGHGFRRRVLSRRSLTDRQLLRAGSVGIGVNMAFRREVLLQAGGFDEALDVGTPSSGAGDIEMFHRLMAQGHTVVYEPRMLVWHTHRRQLAETKKQIKDNGRSFGCYLLTCSRHKTVPRAAIVKFLLLDWLLKWVLRNLVKPPAQLPRKFSLIELAGMLQSPAAYKATQKWARNHRAAAAPVHPEKTKTLAF